MIKSNFHTHTVFCDGKDTPEEMVLSAIEKGFDILGFSGHSYLYCDREVTMNSETEPEYRREVTLLKEKYKDKIKIFCGIEQDYYSHKPHGYDYIIGSVHNVLKNGKHLSVDHSAEILQKNVSEYYGGDFDAFAEDYFRIVADVVNKTDCDIIGHFDLISKYSEKLGFSQSERFLAAAENAVKALIPFGRPFEINTGAIARKARTIPYPSAEILKMIKSHGGKIVFSSDCHDKSFLDCHFDEIEKLALDFGFTEHGIVTDSGIKYIKI